MVRGRSYVYEWINKVNGKWYIGSHDGSNPNYKASGKLINKAFNKYGMDNFICHKFYCDDYRKQEQDALVKKDAMNDPMSYNLTNIARSWDHISWKGIPKSEETKKKMSESAKGRKRPDLSERNRKHPPKKGAPKKTVVEGIEYKSRKEAAEKLGINYSTFKWMLKHNRI